MAHDMISIPLLASPDYECSYLPEQLARSAFINPYFALTPIVYEQLLKQGYRRSGDEVYKPYCRQCHACIPCRIPVRQFKPNRGQQRCWKKHANTTVVIKPPVFEQAHYDLYMRYQKTRHSGGGMEQSSPEDYINFLSSRWCTTCFAEISVDNQLAGVAIIDQFPRSWSAVYTFFDPELEHLSLGIYAVLWQIQQLKQHRLDYLYLGYWIKECRKMAYKDNYQPLEILENNQWRVLERG